MQESMKAFWIVIVSYFESQSALANFLQIAGVFLPITFFLGKKILSAIKSEFSLGKHKNLSAWISSKRFLLNSAKNLRIAIIDDQLSDYPVDALIQYGYDVTTYTLLNLAKIPSLYPFHFILLDINGVLEEDLKSGGMQILKKLKSHGDYYVVAVSSRGFDITMSEFFMLADSRLKKPIPQADIESLIEKAFISRYSATDAAHRLDEAIMRSACTPRTQKKVYNALVKYLEFGVNFEIVEGLLHLVAPGVSASDMKKDVQIIKENLLP